MSSPAPPLAAEPNLRLRTARGRRSLAATVVGSGMVFLDGTVVNVALPAIRRDLHADLAGLEWVASGFLLTLGALLLLGGALGDVRGRRRVFTEGLVLFTVASVGCALAPSLVVLIAARVLQGIGGALLVPQSLAIVTAVFCDEDRGAAIGAWSGLSGLSTAIGPFVGGYLVDTWSWRWAFLINVPLAGITWWLARAVPETHGGIPDDLVSDRRGDRSGGETRDVEAPPRLDVPGAVTATLGLAGLVYALIQGPDRGFARPDVAVAGLAGVALLIAFAIIERRTPAPMVPLSLFRSRRFTGANLTTVTVYAALGAGFFFLTLQLQTVLGYSALGAGAATVPVVVLLATLSSLMGRVAQKLGPRLPMTVGPLVAAGGFVLLSRIAPGSAYLPDIFPGMVVFGLGLAITVAPLVGAVLMSVPDRYTGTASGINNAVSRVAQLLAIALVPWAAGLSGVEVGSPAFARGYVTASLLTAGLLAAGGLTALFTVGPRSAPSPGGDAPAIQ